MFCIYYMKYIKTSTKTNGVDTITINVNKHKVNLNNAILENKDGKREIEMVKRSEESVEAEELYENGDMVQTPKTPTTDGEHNDNMI